MAGHSLRISGEVKSSLFGKTFQRQLRTVSAAMGIPFSALVPPAKVGQLTTRTSASVGTLTMAASHGIATADVFDLYWTENGVPGKRIGVLAGTVSGNSVPITAGAGDNLPTNLNAITAMEPVIHAAVVVGDDVTGILADSDVVPATVRIMDNAGTPATAAQLDLDTALDAYLWDIDSGLDNPLAGKTTTTVRLSHGSSTESATIRGALLYD